MKKLFLLAICLLAATSVANIQAQRTKVPSTNGTTSSKTTTSTTPVKTSTGTTTTRTTGINNVKGLPKMPTKGGSTAIGIRLGAGTMGTELGISLQQKLNTKNYLEGIVSMNKYDFRLTGLYQYHYPLAIKGLTAFGGVGAHVGQTRTGGFLDVIDILNGNTPNFSGGSGTFSGVDAIGGVMYKAKQMPINISLDVKPAYTFNNHPKKFEIGAGLTIRWTFGSGGGGGSGTGNGSGNGSGTNANQGGNGSGTTTGTQTKDSKVKPYPGGNTSNTTPTTNTNTGGNGRGNTTNPANNPSNNNGGSGGGSGTGSGGGNSNGETYDGGGNP